MTAKLPRPLEVGRTVEKTKVELAVDSLRGKSPDEIATMMRECHIQGRPGTTRSCPLAVYIHETWGGDYRVGPLFIMRIVGGVAEKTPTPAHWSQFIKGFDQGKYPDLIAPPPRLSVKAKRRKQKSVPRRKGGPRSPNRNHPAIETGRWSKPNA